MKDTKARARYSGKTYDSADSIAEFFKNRAAQMPGAQPTTRSPLVKEGSSASRSPAETRNSKLETASVPGDFTPGSYVRHAKYGRGLVLRREGTGDSLKLTVTFPGYGQKKLIQKYAGLELA